MESNVKSQLGTAQLIDVHETYPGIGSIPVHVRYFKPFGLQVKDEIGWAPQETKTSRAHLGAAISLGESDVHKFAITFPLRTGLPSHEDEDFGEGLEYIHTDGPRAGIQELYYNRGVCVVSEGPIGGPSKLLAIYRPIRSYGTGVGIKSVLVASFPEDPADPGPNPRYICLVERAGISMFLEGSSESHVAHVPEFKIQRVLSSSFGLIVVPFFSDSEFDIDSDNGLFIITHPIKQISRIWIKPTPNYEYVEYTNEDEKLLWCEKDLCIFWNQKTKCVPLRRLIGFDREEVLHNTTLNASGASGASTPPSQSSRLLNLGVSGNIFSPHPNLSKTPCGPKVYRESDSVSFWPSFNFTSGSPFAAGFCPPHTCIYDDPQLYLRPLFQLEFGKISSTEPSKFQLVSIGSPNPIALCFLVSSCLITEGVDLEAGSRLSHFRIPNVMDFTGPVHSEAQLPVLVVLDTTRTLRLIWVDSSFNYIASSELSLSIGPNRVSSINKLFGNSIHCTTEGGGPFRDPVVEQLSQFGEYPCPDGDSDSESAILNLPSNTSASQGTGVSISDIHLDTMSETLDLLKMSCGDQESHSPGSMRPEPSLSPREAQSLDLRSVESESNMSVSSEGSVPGSPKGSPVQRSKERNIVIEIKDLFKHGLIRRVFQRLRNNCSTPSQFTVHLIARLMSEPENPDNETWTKFEKSVIDQVVSEQGPLGIELERVLGRMTEEMKTSSIATNYIKLLNRLLRKLHVLNVGSFDEGNEFQSLPFQNFYKLLQTPNPLVDPIFDSLPPLIQLLLEDPDSKIQELVQLKSKEIKLAPALQILIQDVLSRNRARASFALHPRLLEAMGRADYLSGSNLSRPIMPPPPELSNLTQQSSRKQDGQTDGPSGEGKPWHSTVLSMRVFAEDRRLEEVCRLLDSSATLIIELEQMSETSDHDFVEEQEKQLLSLIQISFSAPVGRGAFSLRTEEKDNANLTSIISIPRIVTAGKDGLRGTNIELPEADLPPSSLAWPNFHNGVASSLSVSFRDPPADAWFAYNKSKTLSPEGTDQAGMILGFGLNGILAAMPPTLRHEHLARENSFTTMAFLLGLSANFAGTGDIMTWKLVSIHINAMLPACTTELEVPRLATLIAPFALGLLFIGTHHTHVSKVLLGEISKRFSPLSMFGGPSVNHTGTLGGEPNGVFGDREAHSLCAGFGLGFVSLGKGRSMGGKMGSDEGIDGILRRFVVGGPKPTQARSEQDGEDPWNQSVNSMPSLWEEYRCCHIEEGENVNVDVTTPSAIMAVALIYLRSGNDSILQWLSPPRTLHLLDGVRPDILMLRSLASTLIYDEILHPDVSWLEDNLMPRVLLVHALKIPDITSKMDHESINQAWACIASGYCLGLAIRFSGTSDRRVWTTLWYYTHKIYDLSSSNNKLSEYFPKNLLESSLCTLLLSLSLVMAGTGNLKILRLCRYLQSKIGVSSGSSAGSTYGLEMCIGMSTGILFLGGGRYSLSNDDRSIALILASVFPKWPINASDNRYHMQALRHLYVLAAQPRLLLPKPMPHGSKLYFEIEFLDGQITRSSAPLLLPPFHLLKRVSLSDPTYVPFSFNLPDDLPYLQKIVQSGGHFRVIPKPRGTDVYGVFQNMAWMEEHSLHSTFKLESRKLENSMEGSIIRRINRLSWVATEKGVPEIIYPLMTLQIALSSQEQDAETTWQINVLESWYKRALAAGMETCLSKEILDYLRNE